MTSVSGPGGVPQRLLDGSSGVPGGSPRSKSPRTGLGGAKSTAEMALAYPSTEIGGVMTITDYIKIRTQCDEIRRFPVFDYVTSTDYETPHPLDRKSYAARRARAGPGGRRRARAARHPHHSHQ